MSIVELIRQHAKAGQRYSDAYRAFRDAFCELRAVERVAANSNIAVPLDAAFPNSNLPDPRQFQHSILVPQEPWDGWKTRIETRANELFSKLRKDT
jgi:hypothetical protein